MRVLGLMSGTSMDGVDAAVLETDGEAILGFGPSAFLPFTEAERDILRAGLGLWPEAPEVAAIEALSRAAHARAVAGFADVDLVGYHGQTLAHDPKGRGTHQAGRGDLLARETGLPVVWDFRAADVASGGEGAPLVPFFHFACARFIGAETPLAFLNLGGVGNVTWVDPRQPAPEAEGALLAFDTGPGNALIDDFLKARTGASFDADGATAGRGRVAAEVLADLGTHPYILRTPPKSLDRQDFHGYLDRVSHLSAEDGAATLAALTAACVAEAARHFPEPPSRWLVHGGGRRNLTLTRMIAARTNAPVDPVEVVGLDGDMLEAQAFAFLAARVVRGLPTSSPATTGARLPVSGGRISRP
ncbi:anhydro-N-acetylmuramic acid kinase [Amaricoccus solimangrovi]|uniref:Anhydro-N-acetylmuramic acid kinase n=1 Tax=Amaricoccus solimangrovi TaxID=2589815 RepID=A0A501WYS1_9RHOB|nr:anhydro-N-acetylmuramic acid kinase [Amaricoccus solimangrovi]TPE53810.1 anhydro-N-acetylmuramic acid kinase [Amaricoccus solimangrovi]